MNRTDDRSRDQLRPVTIERDFIQNSPGSVLYRSGATVVLVTAHISDTVPPFLEGKALGWLTAEYAMLPGSTPSRKAARRRRPCDRDPAADRPQPAGRRRPRGTRSLDDPCRRRRAQRRRRHAHRRDHRGVHRRRRRDPAGSACKPVASFFAIASRP